MKIVIELEMDGNNKKVGVELDLDGVDHFMFVLQDFKNEPHTIQGKVTEVKP